MNDNENKISTRGLHIKDETNDCNDVDFYVAVLK